MNSPVSLRKGRPGVDNLNCATVALAAVDMVPAIEGWRAAEAEHAREVSWHGAAAASLEGRLDNVLEDLAALATQACAESPH